MNGLNMIFEFLVIIGVLTSGIYSVPIVNDVPVNSDALSDLFFKEIQNNHDLLNISGHDTKTYNTRTCVLSIREMLSQFPSRKVAPFFDSWGKIPSGLLKLNLYDIGNFDECVQTSVTLSARTGLVSGQYCFATIPAKKPEALKVPKMEGRDGLIDMISINIGICVPDSCSPEFLTSVFELSLGNVFNGALSGISIGSCTNGRIPNFKTIDIIGITFFSFIVALMILSSIYDFFTTYFGKSPIPVLLAFSILTNSKKLFAINTKKSLKTIDCLTGIRVFSMIWVMYGHTYGNSLAVPVINTIDIFPWFKAFWSMHILNATVSVDSFFFIGGVLVAWIGFRELDRTKGKLNIVMMYVHRYIRLTPLVAAGLLFLFSVNKFIGTGPFKQSLLGMDECNGYNWWPVLLYIQNYYVQDTACFPPTWYLAIDFQLYILSPLLLIPMWKWGKKFSPVLVVLSLLSIGCVMATYFTEGYTDLKGQFNEHEWEKTYTPTHTRYSPWLVGFGLGYFMHINQQRVFRLSKILQLAGWTVSFIIIVSILFGPYSTISKGDGTVFEAAMYESLKRVSWAIALAWITFACQFGFGGVVDAFLSHPFWQPLGRLTYSLYLVHLVVIFINLGMTRTSNYFSDYNEILNFWETFGTSLMMAIASTLAFESPIPVLEKAIFGRGKPENKLPVEAAVPPQIIVVDVPNKDV